MTLHDLASVGAVMLLGLLGGKLAHLARLPRVSGYIVTGIIIGPSVLGLISHQIVESISIINDIALGLIMFAIGGVFEIHHIRSVGNKIVWLTIGQSLATMLIIAGALSAIGMDVVPAILLGTIGIATAPAATLLVIREFEARGEFTDTLITLTATSNVVCILAFEFALSFFQMGKEHSALVALLGPIYELGGSLVVGGIIGFLISKWEQHVEDQAELLMIIIAGIMLCSGVAYTLKLQPLFATLIMGAVTTNLSMMHRLAYVEIRQVEQPLYIAFFVLAGASLHLELLPSLGLAGVVYLITRVFGKSFGIWAVARWKGLEPSVRRYLGLGMAAQAGVAIGLVAVVQRTSPQLGLIITPIILATVLIYETTCPPLIEWVLFRAGDAQRHF
jgi:Kef-type K+ transport system membrane component KefB